MGICCNKWQVDFGFHGGREFNLGAFSGIPQALQRHFVTLGVQVQTFFFAKLINQPIDQALVDVVAAEMRVSIRGFHFDEAIADAQNRDIKCSAAEVVDGNCFVFFLVQAVGKCGCGGFIDDAFHIQPGNLSGVFGGLALRVIEIGRDRDDGFGNFLTQVVFRRLLQFLENHGRDLLRAVLLALGNNHNVVTIGLDFVGHHLQFFADLVVAPPHETLD